MEDFLYAYNQPKQFGKYDFFLDGKITANEVVYKILTEEGEYQNIDIAEKVKEIESRLQTHFTFEHVDKLPTEGKETVIYLVPNAETSGDKDSYNEYMWVKKEETGEGVFELIGSGTYAQQKAELEAESNRAKAAEKVLTENLAQEKEDREGADAALDKKIEAETKRATEKEATIDAELAKRVPYSLHKNVDVVGNKKDVVKLDVPESSNEAMYCPQGLIMGGSAQAAGLVTRGICGVSSPANDGYCVKENLYINYDGTNTYSPGRQLVIQAGEIGVNYGHNLYQFAASRGDAVKGYVDEKVGKETTDREALQEEVTALKSQVNMLEIRIDFLEGQNISEDIETNNIEEALVDTFTQAVTLNNVVISSPQNLALNKENDVTVSIGSITIDGMTYENVQTIAEGDSFLATDTGKIFIDSLGRIGEKDSDGNITKNVIRCKVNVRGNDADGKNVNVISGAVSITLNGDYKNIETSLHSYLSVLPDGYRRCEYLESTGEQKILVNTESFSDFIRLVVDIQYTKTEADQYQGFTTSGSFFGTDANGYWLQNPPFPVVKATTDRLKITNIFDNGNVDINYDGITGKVLNSNQVTCPSLAFFARADNHSFCRIFSITVESKSGLFYNLIPCLDDTGTPCMYDTVNRKALYNQGTGKFLTNRTLPDGYTELEYLEGTGTQWIDTGIKLSNESDFKMTCDFFNALELDGNPHYAFGASSGSVACYAVLPTRYTPHFYLNGTNIAFIDVAQRCVIEYTNNHVILNGVMKIFSNAGEAVTTTENIAVFSCRLGTFPLIGRIYSFSVSRNGQLQLDLQPALDDQNKPCMYDFVSNTPLYNNATTGDDFVYVLPETGTFALRQQDISNMGSLSENGLRRIERLPFNFDGDMDKFIAENNIKPIVETEMPNDGKTYAPNWVQTEEEIILEWIEVEPTVDEIIN